MKVLIVGDSCAALAAARELGAGGWTVGIGSRSRLSLTALSRWSSHWHYVPPPLGDCMGFYDAIESAVEKHGYEIVFGADDAEVLALSAERERLTPCVPYTAHDYVVRAFDKLLFVREARKAGLITPITRPASQKSLDDFDLPVVVKARLHWTPGKPNQQTRIMTVVARSREEALRQAARMKSIGAEPLFQQRLTGQVFHFVGLTDQKHRIVSQLFHQTTHLGQSESGQSARIRVVPPIDTLTAQIQAFLRELRWFGFVSLQFRLSDTGQPLLMDFNGRMYGALGLANASGMRALDTWARYATGRNATPSQTRVGLRYQALEGDLRRAISEPGVKRIFEVPGCLAHAFGAIHPILSWSDPLPIFSYLARLPKRLRLKLV